MRKDGEVWEAVVAEAGAGSRYAYRLDGQGPFPDPYSRSQPEGPHGASEVVDPGTYQWHDSQWQGLSSERLVIYQLHFGTFTPEGTFDAAIGQLKRLKELGVTAIEPLPVAEFPGARNWGYDGVDLFAPSHVYGGPDGFKRFIDAAHQQGLGVLVDVVYNHLGPDGNYLRAFSPDYFTDKFETPWGEAINYANPHVRQFVLDNARYWIEEFHADGLRLDATHAIFDDSPKHILAELSDSVPENAILIAETHENDVKYLKSVKQGGFGIDAVWADDFHHALRRYLAGDHEGYYARFEGTLAEVARCIQQRWLRNKPAPDQPPEKFVYVIQNHDQVGNRPFGDRLNHGIDKDRYEVASMLLLFLPQTPMVFMGQEFCASSPFQYFTDHNPELGKLVTEGRRKEFKDFAGFNEVPDPQAEETFLASKLKLEEAEGSPVQDLYRRMLALRPDDAVLSGSNDVEARAPTTDVLAVRRWRGSEERLLVCNFGDAPYRVTEQGWRPLVSSSEGSPGQVPPRSATVYARP